MGSKIGIVGDGTVGSALARGLARAGHEVRAVGKDERAIAEFHFVADNPGLTVFHCHQQLHMDFGFMALFEYV